jgi:polyisoprenoid-binding protein YceI
MIARKRIISTSRTGFIGAHATALASRLALVALLFCVPVGGSAQRASFASLNGQTGLPVQRFDIDWPHSAVEFSVRFMGLSTVRGAFASFGGTVMYNPSSIPGSSVSVVIETNSINTNVEFRDKDLKSPNFFDAEKYPLITFHSEQVEKSKDGFVARGPLTMHGVTHPVAVEFVQIHPVSSDAWGNKRVGFVGHLSLNRKDYGILGTKFWNSEYDPGRMSVSDNVDIDLTLEAEVNQVEKWGTPKGDSLLAASATKGMKTVLSEFRAAASDTTSATGKISDGALSALTVKLMHRGRYDDAIDAYKLAIDLHPNASWAYAGLGEAQLMSGRKAAAVENFRKALATDTTNTVAYEYLRYVH